jgi:hypothetical protein
MIDAQFDITAVEPDDFWQMIVNMFIWLQLFFSSLLTVDLPSTIIHCAQIKPVFMQTCPKEVCEDTDFGVVILFQSGVVRLTYSI